MGLAENFDIELYTKDVNKSLLDNYDDKTEFCLCYRVVENSFSERFLKKVNFKIGEQMSDDYDLKESWGNVRSVADFLCLALWHEITYVKN